MNKIQVELHIGQNDLPYEVDRKILGKIKIIELSVRISGMRIIQMS